MPRRRVTIQGRVVYDRKKHEYTQKDAVRILYAQLGRLRKAYPDYYEEALLKALLTSEWTKLANEVFKRWMREHPYYDEVRALVVGLAINQYYYDHADFLGKALDLLRGIF